GANTPGSPSTPGANTPGSPSTPGANTPGSPSTPGVLAPGSPGPLTAGKIALAWMPFALMSVFLMLTGLVRQMEPGSPGKKHVTFLGIQTNYLLEVPFLHEEVQRAPSLMPPGRQDEKEKAIFNFAWLTAPGTAVFLAAL